MSQIEHRNRLRETTPVTRPGNFKPGVNVDDLAEPPLEASVVVDPPSPLISEDTGEDTNEATPVENVSEDAAVVEVVSPETVTEPTVSDPEPDQEAEVQETAPEAEVQETAPEAEEETTSSRRSSRFA